MQGSLSEKNWWEQAYMAGITCPQIRIGYKLLLISNRPKLCVNSGGPENLGATEYSLYPKDVFKTCIIKVLKTSLFTLPWDKRNYKLVANLRIND